MKRTLLCLTFAPALTVHAQWQTVTYQLKGGWNAIHVPGDAAWDTMANMLPAAVEEVWRWNPNPTQAQFTESPLVPSAGMPEWSVWRRNLPAGNTLGSITGQASYLVKCSGTAASPHTMMLKQSVLLPSNAWVRSGANFMGFPALSGINAPFFTNYFATFPAAIAANTRIFKYAGGDLGPSNPVQIFSPNSERLDRTKAYWFSAEAVGNYYAPIEISLNTVRGLTFGRAGAQVIASIRNRTGAMVTLTFAPQISEVAPSGQPAVTGAVPLTRRSFNPSTLVWDAAPVSGAFTATVGPQANVELHFGIDRAHTSMTGAAADAFFASFLRVTDSGNLIDISLPVSATKGTLAGLWVGDISLTQAGFSDAGAGNTPREFPLRTLLHVADDGTATLLSQVFIGRLAAGSHDVGLCTRESYLHVPDKAGAQRLVAAHLPLDRVISTGSGSVGIGQTLTRTVQIPFDDATNPFVHQYHPDHDNKDARGAALPAGQESHNITRTCAFTFTAAPPPGTSAESGWGSSVIGGTYSETISGLHRKDITVSGTFTLRRASEIGTLQTP